MSTASAAAAELQEIRQGRDPMRRTRPTESQQRNNYVEWRKKKQLERLMLISLVQWQHSPGSPKACARRRNTSTSSEAWHDTGKTTRRRKGLGAVTVSGLQLAQQPDQWERSQWDFLAPPPPPPPLSISLRSRLVCRQYANKPTWDHSATIRPTQYGCNSLPLHTLLLQSQYINPSHEQIHLGLPLYQFLMTRKPSEHAS